eukprot:TRINITY_DN143_c2_g1_i1.p1 TRINITY_DN143_c2_g1~~TRINITY_DN143_c2_g1_i1.p1  ORF type:complete len:307 (+),score=90.77 TRINITY_DN143_c2_g1_i1:96-923(+)
MEGEDLEAKMEVLSPIPVRVEMALKDGANMNLVEAEAFGMELLRRYVPFFTPGLIEFAMESMEEIHRQTLQNFVHYMNVRSISRRDSAHFWESVVLVLPFFLHEDEEEQEPVGEDEDIPAFSVVSMPSMSCEGIWETLEFDRKLKHHLMSYARTSMNFSRMDVDCNIIGWNRLVLFHGPPGSGKTSLCKGFAQKVAIEMMSPSLYGTYDESILVEVNAHSLFSKWFSESGKLVLKMFTRIQEFAEEQDHLVFVLIDEVESLTAARKAAMSGNEHV